MAPTPDDPPWLTSRQVAAVLGVHPKHIYRLLKRGLPGRRVGGEWRFRRDEVLAWSQRGGVTTAPPPAVTESVSAGPASLLAANGDVVVRVLLAHLNAGDGALWGFVQADRTLALRWLGEGRVTAAGSHGGAPPARVGEHRVARVHLVEREVGLAARAEKSIPALGALHRARLASRPVSAGVHAHLVDALHRAKVAPEKALARAKAFASHGEVVDAVLRGEADVGLTTRALAARRGLAFRVLATEGYGLLVRSGDLGAPAVVRLCEVAQSAALRAALGAEAGYDPARSGDIRYDP